MSGQDDREIVSSLRLLSHIDPPAELALRMEEFLERRLRRPRRMRIAVIALAAMLLIAIGITLVIVMSSPTASAAENLRKVAQINESFKGWVHIGSDDPKKIGGIYYNTMDYSHANVYAEGRVYFIDKNTRRTLEYMPDEKTIYIGNIDPDLMQQSFDDVIKHAWLTVSIQAMMNQWKQQNPQGNFKVRQSIDGSYERYDVDFPSSNRQTFWVDPKTKLLAKVEINLGKDRDWTNYYRYNDPVVHDIYDVGVPRDAKIVDDRPVGELKEVLDRLDQKVQRGMGDGVAILTKQIFEGDELPAKIGELDLYGESGPNWARYHFNVGSWKVNELASGVDGPPIDLPQDWPAITAVAPILTDLSNRIAMFGFVWDGRAAQVIEEMAIDNQHVAPQVRNEDWIESTARDTHGFPGFFTFGSRTLDFYNPTTSGHIMRDDAHRGLIGIDVAWNDSKDHSLLWIDPARDDVPVEYSGTESGRDHHVYRTERIRYLTFQQAANQRWYPQHWEREIGGVDLSAKNTLHENCYLLIDLNARLDAQWFTDPKKHFGPVTEPVEPKPTTSATQRSNVSSPAG